MVSRAGVGAARSTRPSSLKAAGYDGPIGALGRFAYYERTRAAYAIVATGERRYWGNLILKKGAIPPETPGG